MRRRGILLLLAATITLTAGALAARAARASQDEKPQRLTDHLETVAVLEHERTREIAFSPKGDLVATVSLHGTLKVWSTETWKAVHSVTFQGLLQGVTFSPDGRWLAACGTCILRVWSVSDWQPQPALDLNVQIYGAATPASLVCVQFSPDSKRLLAGGQHLGVLTWTTEDWKRNKNQLRHRHPPGTSRSTPPSVEFVEFAPSGKLLLTGGRTQAIRFWKRSKKGRWKNIAAFKEKPSPQYLREARFSPGGEHLAVVGCRRLQLYSTQKLQKSHDVQVYSRAEVASVEFSADGKQLYTVGTTFRIWETHTGKLAGEYAIEQYGVCVRRSADGQLLAVVPSEGPVRIYRQKDGDE